MSTLALEEATIDVEGRPLRAFVARPRDAAGPLPVVLAWSDIFQLTGPHRRMAARIASRGYLVVAPELYSQLEPPGTVLDFERDRQRALDDAARVELAWVDREYRAVRDWALARRDADPTRLGVCGWCFGGHVAFRAALDPAVRAAACCYPTGLHDDTLGAAKGTADTLRRAGEIQGELLLVWGTRDPHIPAAGRSVIHRALEEHGTLYEVRLFDAEHTFMRDEGARHDPLAADRAFEAMEQLFARRLSAAPSVE